MRRFARLRPLLPGVYAGVVAALLVTLVLTLLRLFIGIPLPVDAVSDRFLPLVPVAAFLQLLHYTGGPEISKQLALFSAFVGQVVLGGLLGALYLVLLRSRLARHRWVVGGALLVLWGISVAVLVPAFDSNYAGLPPHTDTLVTAGAYLFYDVLFAAALVLLAPRRPAPVPGAGPTGERLLERRAFLAGAAGVLAVASGGAIAALYRRSTYGYDGTKTIGPSLSFVTPIDEFYVVTKNFTDPRVDRSFWRLQVSGLVARPRTYGFDELARMPAHEHEMTLECISNGVGGGLISNARWEGVPLRALIEAAGPQPDATWVWFHGADGFEHVTPIHRALADEALLAYRMNGRELPSRHGFPVRALVPGVYGEGNVKWLDRIVLFDHRVEGYYESQGWRSEFVHTMSRIDTPLAGRAVRAGATVPVRGVAFAGNRGVAKVEVSADGGRSWRPARIEHAGTKITWALWSYDWRPSRAGAYELAVRATDREGALQTAKVRSTNPAGASGYHRVPVRVEV